LALRLLVVQAGMQLLDLGMCLRESVGVRCSRARSRCQWRRRCLLLQPVKLRFDVFAAMTLFAQLVLHSGQLLPGSLQLGFGGFKRRRSRGGIDRKRCSPRLGNRAQTGNIRFHVTLADLKTLHFTLQDIDLRVPFGQVLPK
jgi:hypothetical protein